MNNKLHTIKLSLSDVLQQMAPFNARKLTYKYFRYVVICITMDKTLWMFSRYLRCVSTVIVYRNKQTKAHVTSLAFLGGAFRKDMTVHADWIAFDKPRADWIAFDKPRADWIAFDKPHADRLAFDKPRADWIAFNKLPFSWNVEGNLDTTYVLVSGLTNTRKRNPTLHLP